MLKLLAETCVQRHREQVLQSGVVFVTTAIVATVLGVESVASPLHTSFS